MCCSKRCVANKEEVAAVVHGVPGEKGKEDIKENDNEVVGDGPKEMRRLLERVCM